MKLSADGLTVQNYIAGQPFPNVEPTDRQFAQKIMWNYEHGFVNGMDDTDLRNFDADTGSIPAHGPMAVERHFLLDHFRRLFWTGRLYVDPKPDKPNPNGYRGQQGLYPILEPFDLKGVGALGNRYIESSKQDDSWLYLPSLRRVRRLSTAQRSDALFGQDTDVDSYYGYAGHIAWMEWQVPRREAILGDRARAALPREVAREGRLGVRRGLGEAQGVRGRRVTKLPQYAYSKRVLFIDKETWGIPYSDIYDRSRRALEDLDQQRRASGNRFRAATRSSTRTR